MARGSSHIGRVGQSGTANVGRVSSGGGGRVTGSRGFGNASMIHPKVGGRGSSLRGRGASAVMFGTPKAPNPYAQARRFTKRSTGSARQINRPY